MITQTEIEFGPTLLHGEYPLRYHLLRVGNGELVSMFWHINSIWEGYNSSGYPEAETESGWAKYTIASTTKDILKILDSAKHETNDRKTLYIMAKMDHQQYESMPQFRE